MELFYLSSEAIYRPFRSINFFILVVFVVDASLCVSFFHYLCSGTLTLVSRYINVHKSYFLT